MSGDGVHVVSDPAASTLSLDTFNSDAAIAADPRTRLLSVRRMLAYQALDYATLDVPRPTAGRRPG